MCHALRCLLLLLLLAPALPVLGQPQGELVIALPNDPTALYIANASDVTTIAVTRQLYDGLLWLDDQGTLHPGLAERWEVNEDSTQYTFYLRQGVSFHNGEPFTAEAIAAAWEYGLTPGNEYPQYYSSAESVEVLDDYTVRVTTPEPDALFLIDLVEGWFALPPRYLEAVGLEGFQAAPVGTGPFMLEEWVPGDRIVMRAFPDYWNPGEPKVERVVMRVIPDGTTRMAAVQTGEVDVVNRLSVDQAMVLEGNPDVRVLSYPNDRVFYVAFKNLNSGAGTPIESRLVRQAFNHAVNRPGILQALFGGHGQLATGFTAIGNLGYDPALEPYAYDPQRARELLAEAGYADGFTIGLTCPADAYTNVNEVCLAIQRDLAAVGIDLELEFLTTSKFWSEPNYGSTGPMFVDGWSTPAGEALPRIEGAHYPGLYYTSWVDDTITDYVDRLAATIDRDERAALYRELSRYLFDNPPFVYLYTLNIFEATTSRVTGYRPLPTETWYLNQVGVDG